MGINASTIQKLYIAYFNRPADVAGLTYWEGQLDANKISLSGLAQSFSEQVEYVTTYGGKSTAEVVTTLYQNLFGRAPDADGLKYWATQIDTKAVNMGTAALAILNGAVPQSVDGVTIQNKLKFATDFTTSLNTQEKAASYSYAYAFEVMRGILSGVTATSLPPTLVPGSPLKIAEAANGISNAERMLGMDVLVDLKGVQTSVGYKLELMNGNSSFSVPVTHTLTAAEAKAQKALVHIPGGINWGPDGAKMLGIKVTDIFGNSGKVGAQTAVVLDTTAPILPPSATIVTSWMKSPAQGLAAVISEIQYNIIRGENTGGSAVLMQNKTVIGKVANIAANASMLDFVIDPSVAKQVYDDYFSNSSKVLSLVLTDASGNSVTTNLSGSGIWAEYKYKEGTPVSNISIFTDSMNGTLAVKAGINGLEYFNGTAYLKINGQVIASDKLILSDDTTVDFNVLTANSIQVQNLINAGGVVSIAMVGFDGKAVESINNPTLSANQYGSRATLDSNAVLPALPKTGTYFTSYYNQAGFDYGLSEMKYSIVAGQNTGGSASILEAGNVIAKIPYIGANDTVLDFLFDMKIAKQVYNDYFTNKNLSLVVTNAFGYSVSAPLSGIDIRADYKFKDGTPATNIVLTPVGGNIVANTVNSSNTNLIVSANVNGLEYFMSKAYLKINGQIVATDDSISSADTKLNFDLGTSDAVQLQAIVKSGGVVSVALIDMNGKVIESVANNYLVTNFSSSFSAQDTYSQVALTTNEHPLVVVGQTEQILSV
ncbi:DUF4214 domain-containing protein [Undibacterium sp.]|uniref:DUF4214 domain-containing protein n=1 Tax=Undibacterium sp. TaxID=1914977 RepID=UPI002731907D|nr:DUF4214 domain-containing protein [Undibacterium sp.]MDP1978805.1 DUF4214 domain-containing protein [Undibacterium sp.]